MTNSPSIEFKTAELLLDDFDNRAAVPVTFKDSFHAWEDKARALIRRVYGAGSPQEKDWYIRIDFDSDLPDGRWSFAGMLPHARGFLEAVIQDLEVKAGAEQTRKVRPSGPLRIFLVHDGPTGARAKLQDFIRALDAEPVIAEDTPSKGRTVSAKVDAVISGCDYAVALATKARASKQDGRHLARGNVTNELPRVRQAMGDRWMVLLEHGVQLPSNEGEYVHERFSPQSMDQAFLALVRELRGHGFLVVGSHD